MPIGFWKNGRDVFTKQINYLDLWGNYLNILEHMLVGPSLNGPADDAIRLELGPV